MFTVHDKRQFLHDRTVKARGVSRGLLDRYNDRGEHLGGFEPRREDRAFVRDRLGAFRSAHSGDSQPGKVPSAFVAVYGNRTLCERTRHTRATRMTDPNVDIHSLTLPKVRLKLRVLCRVQVYCAGFWFAKLGTTLLGPN